ncbi:MAG TPA: FISUMP domain-containing protein [Bacteroidales bacterium]|nr:FISUMP domain-containing protein [Bacteroidales bacterium]HNS46539.1 FISUMP domain-containing protein [Bacteroidales bacterium]
MKKSLLLIPLMTVVGASYTTRLPATHSRSTYSGTRAEFLFEPKASPPECIYTLYGDANGDEQVNLLDIITTVNYIMGESPDPFDPEAADANGDGLINILDIIGIVNIIMETPGAPCPGIPTVSYGGQIYETVQIGDQCWFRENLSIGTLTTGTIEQSNNGIIEKYCYDNDPVHCNLYGGLYQWSEAMNYQSAEGSRGICPAGWHVPREAEFVLLADFLGGQDVAGGTMKEVGTTHWNPPNTGATNESGFTGLPGGYRLNTTGNFTDLGKFGILWSSSFFDAMDGFDRYMSYTSDDLTRTHTSKANGYSVRCLKDCEPQPSQSDAGPDQLDLQDTYTTLSGNVPDCGTGVWKIISGTGGILADTLNPVSGFQGLEFHEYALTWTISTICGSSTDTVFVSFSEVPGLPCPGLPTVTYAGRTYNTVRIGNQCWLKENLDIGTLVPGTIEQSNNGIIEKYCYNNDTALCSIYGGLYQWDEAMQYVVAEGTQGICPLGWHIPTNHEWSVLEAHADSQYPFGDPEWDKDWWRGLDAGGQLKDTTGLWSEPNTGATNKYGFTALPAGIRDQITGLFDEMDSSAYFWTSTRTEMEFIILRLLDFQHSNILRYSYSYEHPGHSIRCIRGCWPPPSQADAGLDQNDVPGTFTTLTGNTPAYGTGVWLLINGTGGTILDTLNPASGFLGQIDSTYVLTWTISNDCGSSVDTVQVNFVFNCGDPLTDSRDGQSYATVLVGTQCWMAENLNIGIRMNSTTGGYQQTDNDTIEKYCYNNDPAQCMVYGALYEWPEAMNYVTQEGTQGICPPNWHIPTDTEWKILTGTVDTEFPAGDPEWNKTGWCGSDAGGNLKETGFVHWDDPNTGATNSSGFTGLPGGYRSIYDGDFEERNTLGTFWSSSQENEINAWSRYLHYNDARISRFLCDKVDAFSVRCLKDD